MKLFFYGLFCILFFAVSINRVISNLQSRKLERWDEQTNAMVVNELVAKQTFPYLQIDGKPFIEKPPIWYYATGLSVSLLGFSNASVRLVSAVSGVITIVLLWYMGTIWYGKIGGITTSLVMLTTNHLFAVNPGGLFSTHSFISADPDSLQILFMVSALYLYSNNRVFLGSVSTALALLTKGPIAIIPFVAYLLHQAITVPGKLFMLRRIVIGTATVIAICVPWYGLMIHAFGAAFAREHIWYHLFQRVSYPLEGHWQPWWFYIQVLTNKQVFWGLELLLGAMALRFLHFRKSLRHYSTFVPGASVILLFVMITLTQTKLAWYVLPLYPFAALVVGNAFGDIFDSTDRRTQT